MLSWYTGLLLAKKLSWIVLLEAVRSRYAQYMKPYKLGDCFSFSLIPVSQKTSRFSYGCVLFLCLNTETLQ